jgi:hypothetical protein
MRAHDIQARRRRNGSTHLRRLDDRITQCGSGQAIFRLDGIGEDAEAGDGDFHSVAGVERAYPGGGSGEDQAAVPF